MIQKVQADDDIESKGHRHRHPRPALPIMPIHPHSESGSRPYPCTEPHQELPHSEVHQHTQEGVPAPTPHIMPPGTPQMPSLASLQLPMPIPPPAPPAPPTPTPPALSVPGAPPLQSPFATPSGFRPKQQFMAPCRLRRLHWRSLPHQRCEGTAWESIDSLSQLDFDKCDHISHSV